MRQNSRAACHVTLVAGIWSKPSNEVASAIPVRANTSGGTTLRYWPMTPVKVSPVSDMSSLTEEEGSSDDVPLLERAEEHHQRMEEVLDALDW